MSAEEIPKSQIVQRVIAELSVAEARHIRAIVTKGVVSGSLTRVYLPYSSSKIVHSNGGVIFCSRYTRLHGLFVKGKEHPATTKFGRIICDAVRDRLNNSGFSNNRGFFTSDELPGYRISAHELQLILKSVDSDDDDFVAIFAYDQYQAQRTNEALWQFLTQVRKDL